MQITRVSVLLLVAVAAAGCRTVPTHDPLVRSGAVELFVGLDHGVRVVGARSSACAVPHHAIPLARLTPKTVSRAPLGGGELVITWYDGGGRALATYGWPWSPEMFGDVLRDDGTRTSHGGALHPALDQRLLEVPAPETAAYLGMFRTAVVASGRSGEAANSHCIVLPPRGTDAVSRRGGAPIDGNQLEADVLGLYALGSTRRSSGILHFEAAMEGLPGLDVRGECVVPLPSFDQPCRWPLLIPNAHVQAIHRTGAYDDRFNIVILGDGFTGDESSDDSFDTWANSVAKVFLNEPPFSALTNLFNVVSVATRSNQGGITKCPLPFVRDTYYHVEGEWADPVCAGQKGTAGFFGTYQLCRIMQTVEQVTSWCNVDLVIMLAHCNVFGGDADFDNRIVYIPTCRGGVCGDEYWKNLVLHESAHVTAHLGEEDEACCAPYDSSWSFPNVATAMPDLAVPWQHLALPSELTPDGRLSFRPACNEACAPEGRLGLVCGSQYGDGVTKADCPEGVCNPAPWAYRPTCDCQMRTLGKPFCRVCTAAIEERIRSRAAPAPRPLPTK